MAELSIVEGALTGLRFVRQRPGVIAMWTALQIFINSVSVALLIMISGPSLARLAAASRDRSNPQATLSILAQLAPMYGVMMILALVTYAVIYAAMNRAVLKPQDNRFAYLRLGRDEVRQGLLMLAYMLMALVAYFAVVLVTAIILGILAVFVRSVPGGIAIQVLPFLTIILVMALFLFLGVRVSLASAMTFDKGRVEMFGTWSLTRGRFWPMFATYLLALILAALVSVVAVLLVAGADKALNPSASVIQSLFRPDTSSLTAYFTPARIVYILVLGAASAMVFPVLLMPGADIYRRLAPSYSPAAGRQRVEEVFS